VVDDAIRFVSYKSRENHTSSSFNHVEDTKESNEHAYGEDKDQLEEEQEEEIGETVALATTTNSVF
jgi:hypothetical protein